ncbi:MGC86332 protein precursor [Xenopus laevis]|uniref:Meprin A subunit n=1 Tax=Xenopus laevis TaxID=8355 RepID=Q6AX28_XENLA|nr:uncharacterized protein LOC447263 precursor [Xenopus laevis]AAH79789.1 MGC86332 protein [Xenopus laevis]
MGLQGSLQLCSLLTLVVGLAALSINHRPQKLGNDADAGERREDIPQINLESGLDLFEGDIVLTPQSHNALRDDKYRWSFPIPYILADNLGLNAKSVILKTFEMFRLKSCVDFKPYEGEPTYIHFQKFGGCWSMVGDLKTGQNLSIGERCDYKAIVEHEILHALGFYHEQSRSDRDDYVKIWWDEITSGLEHNFNKYENDFITDLNTPYDYESVMHYGPLSFNKNENVPTITAKIEAFNDIIGQRLDFSEIDLERLNRMYNCTASHTLLDQCSFEFINICGMIQGTNDNADWVHMMSEPGLEDHTIAGGCQDAGYFMFFDTHSGPIGSTGLLESRILYPKRSEQCLQFFYKMERNSQDKLVIWLRIDDGAGNVRKMRKIHTIYGDRDNKWKIAHVTLNADKKFRYVFQGVHVNNKTRGGILLDDISLTETPCPNAVWQVRDFSQILESTTKGDRFMSNCFTSPEGYGYAVSIYPHGQESSPYVNYTGISFHMCSGEDDDVMEWPALNRQAIITILDQDPNVQLRMSSSRSFTTLSSQVIESMNNISRWERPSLIGKYDVTCDCYRTLDFGWSTFISHSQLHRRSFLKNDNLILFVDFEDLAFLSKTEVPIKAAAPREQEVVLERSKRSAQHFGETLCDPNPCLNGGVCVQEKGKASCRCSSSQAFFYAGEQCESMKIHGNVLGMLIGGGAGAIALTMAILAIISRR